MVHPRALRAGRSTAVALVLVALLAATFGVAAPAATAAPSSTDWLGEVNLLRSLAGLAPVANVPSWSTHNFEHARWMVENDLIMHGAIPGTPWYTAGADLAGRNSDLILGTQQMSNRSAVDHWMAAPFHGVGIIDPELTQVGFGSYYDATDPGMRWGAGLDVTSDLTEAGSIAPPTTFPVVWPAAGSTLHLTTHEGPERPDPLTSCPGYGSAAAVGVPLYALFANQSGSVSQVSLTRIGDGASMPRCWFDWTSYVNPSSAEQTLGRNVIGSRNAVIVLPASPLQVGQRYRLTVVRGGVTAHSTFDVGTVGAPTPKNPVGSLGLVASPQKGKVRVGGWAADWSAPTTPISVHVYVDGVGTSLGAASGTRTDVAAAWPELGAAHGFDATIDAAPGMRNVCVYAIDVGPGVNTKLGCQALWVADPASPFLDVLSTSAFFADILWVVDNGYATGFPDQTFQPASPVSRQAMARFLYRMAGSPPGPFEVPAFSDVPAGHPFFEEISWMVSEGITTGYGDGTFRPTAGVTRQSTAAFIWRYDGEPPPSPTAPTFTDVGPTHPFLDAISWVAGQGIAAGYADGRFRGGLTVTRQAMAAFLHRHETI